VLTPILGISGLLILLAILIPLARFELRYQYWKQSGRRDRWPGNVINPWL
jgi:hypothetical protein